MNTSVHSNSYYKYNCLKQLETYSFVFGISGEESVYLSTWIDGFPYKKGHQV